MQLPSTFEGIIPPQRYFAALFEGDIAGVPVDNDPGARSLHDDPGVNIFSQPYYSALNLATYPDQLWPDGRVPYMLEPSLNQKQRAAIAQVRIVCMHFFW